MTDWRHLGVVWGGGSRLGDDDERPKDVDAALTLAIAKYGEPSPYDKGQFRTGFYVGIASGALNWAGNLMQYMNREQIVTFSQDAEALYAKYRVAVGLPPDDNDDTD